MTLEIELVDVEERTIAAVRARIAMSDIPDKIFPLMDRVWAFIRGNGIEGFGHNIWLYGTPSGGEVGIEIGVQVPEAFEATSDIVCSSTPSGKAARAIHFGDYSELPPGQHDTGLVVPGTPPRTRRALLGNLWRLGRGSGKATHGRLPLGV